MSSLGDRGDEPRVAIVGGGIGGWTLLRALRRQGLRPRLHEQAPAFGDVGAGVQLSPNATKVLAHLGLGQRLADVAVPLETAWELRRWRTGRVVSAAPLGASCVAAFGAPYYAVHRADLHELLATPDDGGDVRLGARCVAAGQDTGGAWVELDDGSVEEADVVVGADGVHSAVRAAVTVAPPPTFAHLVAHRAVVDARHAPALARRPVATSWLGPGRHLVHYPVRGGEAVNVVAAVPAEQWEAESWSARGEVAELAHEFRGWDERVRALIGAAREVGRHAMFDREPLPRWVNGRIALLGDAAHPMLPALAQGAAQTIEDAAVLARCLARSGRAGAPAALEHYESARRPRATAVQQLSRARPTEYHLPDGPAQRARDAAAAGRDRTGESAWLWSHDATAITPGAGLPGVA